MDLIERIRNVIVEHRLLARGGRIIVAVSGGVDSMVLLHVLHALASSFRWKLSVAHFNHRLRGGASDGDERFVRSAARTLRLACDVGRADVKRRAEREGISVEMAARDMRHAFLARCARKRNARIVVLAQHADDQVELFLMRLVRGAGSGLGGMRARTASSVDRNVMLVRPLLECFKAELEKFAHEWDICFRDDASNASPEHDRNWVRLNVLPLLRQRYPAVARTLLRSMRITQAESDFVRNAADAWLAGNLTLGAGTRIPFGDLQVALQRQVLQAQLLQLGCEADFQLVEHLRQHPGQAASFALGMEILREESGRVRKLESKVLEYDETRAVVRLPPTGKPALKTQGSLKFSGLTLYWRLRHTTRPFSPVRRNGREFFDADRVGAHLLLRHWRPGDRFQPIGLTSPRKLQDWFVNRKVPAAQRRRLVLAENEQGDLFWVQGERIGEACKITPATRRILELRWKQP